jgi:hypothetical protein
VSETATRTIVTFHPEVSCDVCGRSLLRGEQSETFMDSGRQRNVCELCAPRAAQAGWRRASGPVETIELPEARQRSTRALLRRLRGTREEREERRPRPSYESRAIDNVAPASPAPPPVEPYDGEVHDEEPLPAQEAAALPAEHSPVELAAELFNASEFPRRISGVARSLGVPEVSIWSAEHHPAVVRIVVAWELSWYRYEVDLTELEPGARVIDQGSELGDLPREERLGNAAVDESGHLVWTTV